MNSDNTNKKDWITIRRQNNQLKFGHKGAVIWFTGLSGAGKSTLARELVDKLQNLGCLVHLLDGDDLRAGINKDLKFNIEDRKENIRRAGQIALLLYNAGFLVVCTFISPFEEDRKLTRLLIPAGGFLEVFIKCGIKECIKRDPKNLYKKALTNLLLDFTGISSPYEVPLSPDLILDTEITAIDFAIEKLLTIIKTQYFSSK